MRLYNLLILFALLLPLGPEALAQDKILMLNGKEIPCRIIQVDSFTVDYIPLSKVKRLEKSQVDEVRHDSLVMKNGTVMPVIFELDSFDAHSPYFFYREKKEKIKHLSIYRVFNVQKIETDQPFTPVDDSVQISNIETVIYQQDTNVRKFDLSVSDMRAWVMGRRSARRNFHSPMSTVGGALTGLAGGITLNYFFSYIPAVVYTAINGSIRPKVKHTGPEDQPFVRNEFFIEAYRMQANKLKLKNSLIGAVPALVGGVLINYFLIP